MEVRNDGVGDALKATLRFNGFTAADAFGECVTYERAGDPLKIHVSPDGSFTALDGEERVVTEGIGAQDLFAMLVTRA